MSERYFEDYPVGCAEAIGTVTVTEEQIVQFARDYDPQPIHVDREAAAQGPYGGIIASGWHTCALVMRLLVDHYISSASALGSPGIDELHWLLPVRPGDRLAVDVEVVEARPSRSKPDRGIVRTRIQVVDQSGATVLRMVAANLILTRAGAHPTEGAARPR